MSHLGVSFEGVPSMFYSQSLTLRKQSTKALKGLCGAVGSVEKKCFSRNKLRNTLVYGPWTLGLLFHNFFWEGSSANHAVAFPAPKTSPRIANALGVADVTLDSSGVW